MIGVPPLAESMPDRELLDAVAASAGRRLADITIASSGVRFLLASALHVPSGHQVLLTISRPESPDGRAQLGNINRLLTSAKSEGIGTILDRYWSIDLDLRGVPVWTCIVTTWHPDAQVLERAIVGHANMSILSTLRSVTNQVAAVHRSGFAHGDISISNVLVASSGSTHLIDLEHVTDSQFLFEDSAFYTEGYSHPARLSKMKSKSYSLAEAQAWDRFALGRLFLNVLADADPYQYLELTLFNQRAIRLIACLLLDGQNTGAEVALGFDVSFFQADKFTNLDDVVEALDRVIGSAAPEVLTPELRAVPDRVVEVGSLQPVPFTRRVQRLVESPEMQQLSTCLQLGLINYIWPTATHTRIEHAIGTFGMACEAVLNLYADPQSPIFRVLVTPRLARTLLAACLLHDVGHYPLAHDLEEAFPGVFSHEARSIAFIVGGEVAETLSSPEPEGWAVDPRDVASVIEGSPVAGASISPWICGLFHSIISGAIDVDKLDYLVRDSNALGVAAGGGIDVDRVLSSLTVALVPAERKTSRARRIDVPRLAVRSKGVRPAELVGRIRSHMFGVTYWHHSYRSIKAMIHWIVWQAVLAGGSGSIVARANRLSKSLFLALDSQERESFLPGFERQWRSLSQMPQREGAVLAFLVDYAKGSASPMLRLLERRRWFKPVLTIDHFKNVALYSHDLGKRDQKLWEVLDKLPEAGDQMLTARVAIAHEIQRRISSWIEPRTEGAITETLVKGWGDKKVELLIACATEQLFLLDVVESKKSVEKNLYFAVQERKGLRLSEMTQGVPVRQSFDQHQLHQEFLISNGAIRLLCHPDFDDFVARSIPVDELFEIVLAAARAVLVPAT